MEFCTEGWNWTLCHLEKPLAARRSPSVAFVSSVLILRRRFGETTTIILAGKISHIAAHQDNCGESHQFHSGIYKKAHLPAPQRLLVYTHNALVSLGRTVPVTVQERAA